MSVRKARKEPGTHRRSVGSAALIVVALSVLTALMAGAGWLRGFETAALDTWLGVTARTKPSHVTIVVIGEEDYDQLFGRRSPLDGSMLHQLLVAIAAGRPRVIGVDLDTADVQLPAEVGKPVDWPPVVWARDAVVTDDSIRALPVLGQSEIALPSGVALLPIDPDGIVRRFRRRFRSENGTVDSFPWAVLHAFCQTSPPPDCNHLGDGRADLTLNFAGDRYVFTRVYARYALQAAHGDDWPVAGPLRDRIVLVGGTYRTARDEYVTPLGPKAGVELMAQAIESDIQGSGIRNANVFLMASLEIAGGLLLLVVHHRWPVRIAITLGAIPLIALVSSLIVFASFAYWANFVPVLVAVFLHEFHHHVTEHRRLRARLAVLEGDK
jgi:CHASE2 domain-containing sensor protein